MAMSPRLLRPIAARGNPLPRTIAGLQGWWDFSDASTLTIDTGVSEVRDKSGNGLHATQAVGSDQPLLVANAKNGLSAADFDGTATERLITGTVAGDLTAFTVFTVFEPHVLAAFETLWGRGASERLAGNSTGQNFRVVVKNETNAIRAFGASSVAVNTWFLSTASWDGVGDQRNIQNRINTVDAPATTATAFTANSVAGTAWYLGGRQGSSQGWNGNIGEIIAYDRQLTASEILAVEGYLAWKWGLQAQLPYDHPYARSFPGYGSQTTPTDPDAQTYLAAVAAADGTGVEVSVANAVDDFVKGCKTDGIWSAIKASCILMGARTLSGALTPLVGVAPTNHGPFVSGDYNRKTGLIGDGTTKYLNSNRNNNADPQNSRHLSIYISAADSRNGQAGYIGAGGFSVGSSTIQVNFLTGNMQFRSSTQLVGSVAAASATGFAGCSRSASASYTGRVSGGSTTITEASRTPFSEDVEVFNRGRASSLFSNYRCAFYSIGESIDLALLDTRVSALYTAIGAAIP